MKSLVFALAAASFLVVSGTDSFAQACKGSCSGAKKVCMQNSRGNESICDNNFRQCMATGTWMRQDRYRGPQITNNICKR